MLLPPLKDGCLYLSPSSLETFERCPRAFEYSKVKRRVLAASRPSLTFGGAAHVVWRHRYKTVGNKAVTPEVAEQQARLLDDFLTTNPLPEGDWRNVNWAHELFIDRYNKRFGNEPFQMLNNKGAIMTEVSFCVHLFDFVTGPLVLPVFMRGIIDLPVVWTDRVFIIDHKTGFRLDESFHKAHRVSSQPRCYIWAFWKATGIRPEGFIINAVRTSAPPGKPQKGIEAWWEDSYSRQTVETVDEDELVEWQHNTIAVVKNLLHNALSSSYPCYRSACVGKYGTCQYYDCCTQPEQSREGVLASDLFMDNISPLDEETKNQKLNHEND